jgi:hypothetical protein
MKKTLLLICLLLPSCIALQKRDNRKAIRYVNKHHDEVYAIADSLSKKGPLVTDSSDFTALGRKISVFLQHTYRIDKDEPIDSIVVFEKWSFFLGIREIIYDFSANPKTYRDVTGYKNLDHFKKIAPRLYISRKAIPIM